MKSLLKPLFVIVTIGAVQATEPLFIVKVNDDLLVLDEKRFNSTEDLKRALKAQESPDEVMLHVHKCLSVEKLASVVNELLPEFKSRIWVYGKNEDSQCRK